MATNMLKTKKGTYSQSRITVKKRSNFTPDNLFLKTLIEGLKETLQCHHLGNYSKHQ